MILNTDQNTYRNHFVTDPHPFVSAAFIGLNAAKADQLVHLIDDSEKVGMGLVAGVCNNKLLSPFSAPYGGFHFKNENIYADAIYQFLNDLVEYASHSNLTEIKVAMAPDIYSPSTNAKLVNAFLRTGFTMQNPDITGWVNLNDFKETFSHAASRTYYNQALKKGLSFHAVNDVEDKKLVYNLVVENRARMGRPIHMGFNDLIDTAKIFGSDYFKVVNAEGEIVAGAIFYRTLKSIAYAVFWGDSELGRPLRAMDYLVFHLWSFYKKAGFKYIDLGKSTVDGVPNKGLLRFKETHECTSSLRFTFSWLKN